MKPYLAVLLLFPLLLTGCGSDSIADRLYAQALGLSEQNGLILTLQSSEDESCRTVRASSLAQGFALEEAQAGGKVFIGHTELICIDRSVTPALLRELFYEDGISPACKLLCTSSDFLRSHDSTPVVHTQRMAEKDGLLPQTDIATVMEEWLGAYQTALLPVPAEPLPGLVLMDTGGNCTRLSDSAARGMLWLRQPPRKTAVVLGKQQIDVRDIRLHKTWQGDSAVYSLSLKAPDCDADTRSRLQKKLTSDCQAAVDAVHSANADVIGLQTLLESQGVPLPEQLPLVTVRVAVSS